MKRSPLGAGEKSLARGTTFASSGKDLKRKARPRRPRPISPASPDQRAKATVCLLTGCRRDDGWTIDPAHLCSRAHGGCDDQLCVVGLRRDLHEAFDCGSLDLLPHLIAHGLVDEIAHALVHYKGDLLGLAARLCGEHAFVPERQAA